MEGGGADASVRNEAYVYSQRGGCMLLTHTFITFIATSFETSVNCFCEVSSSCLVLHFPLKVVSTHTYIVQRRRERDVRTSNLTELCV